MINFFTINDFFSSSVLDLKIPLLSTKKFELLIFLGIGIQILIGPLVAIINGLVILAISPTILSPIPGLHNEHSYVT